MYGMNYIKSRIRDIKEWLKAKPKPKDRATTAMMGLWAGIWLGIIFACIFTNPTPIITLFWSAITGAIVCSIIGGFFPKYPRILFFPFCLFSIGGN